MEISDFESVVSLRNKVSKLGVEVDTGWKLNTSESHYLRTIVYRNVVDQSGVVLTARWLAEEMLDTEGNTPEVWMAKKLDDRTLLMVTPNTREENV